MCFITLYQLYRYIDRLDNAWHVKMAKVQMTPTISLETLSTGPGSADWAQIQLAAVMAETDPEPLPPTYIPQHDSQSVNCSTVAQPISALQHSGTANQCTATLWHSQSVHCNTLAQPISRRQQSAAANQCTAVLWSSQSGGEGGRRRTGLTHQALASPQTPPTLLNLLCSYR